MTEKVHTNLELNDRERYRNRIEAPMGRQDKRMLKILEEKPYHDGATCDPTEAVMKEKDVLIEHFT